MPSELMKKCRVQVKISPAIMNDLSVRSPDEDGCWRGIDDAGKHWITHQQAREILGDCEYQGNIGGDYIDPVSAGVTRAYRALHKQISSALAPVKTYRVMDSGGGEIVCDIVKASSSWEARELVREAHLGERVRRYVVDEITA